MKSKKLIIIGLVCCMVFLVFTACPPEPQAPLTYTVTYDGNGNTGGAVPVDDAEYAEGDTVTVLDNSGGLSKTGHTFAGWNTASDGSGTDFAAGSTLTMGAGDVVLYAKWTADNAFTLTVSIDGSGSVTKDPDKTEYEKGESVVLTAVPDALNGFYKWEGDASGYCETQKTITMDADKSVTACFLEGEIWFVAEGGTGDGSKSDPWGNIQTAIDNVLDPALIFVSAGSYEAAGTVVTMKEGVSLYGGFSADFSDRKYLTETDRDNASYKTFINNTSATSGTGGNPLAAVLCDGSSTPITSSTVFEGFSVQGGTGDETAAMFCDSNGSPTIRYNTITGVGPSTGYSYGLYSNLSNPRISHNSITGRTTSGTNNAYGVWIGSASGQMTIDYNNIKGGDEVDIAYAIYTSSSGFNLIIEHNTLLGGLTTASSSYGIHEDAVPTASIIRYNTINAGSSNLSSGVCYGIEAIGSLIYNNTIHGGAAWHTYGIYTTNNPVTTILNNTICGGEGDPYAMGVRVGGNDSVIRNNIIFCVAGTDTYGIYEFQTQTPIVKNNDFFDCSHIYSEDGSPNYDTIADMESDINGETAGNASGNVSLDLIDSGGNYYFEDYDGTDNDINTLDDNDWHLTSGAPLNVRGGGLDLSGSFTDDFDGTGRTTSTPTGMSNDGAAGWSMGAYEED